MPSERPNRPLTLYLLIAAMIFQGLSGLVGGIALVTDPTGALIDLPLELISDSVFATYLIPGLVLLIVLGVTPLVVAFGLWRRGAWAWYGSMTVGTGLVIWIAVEIAIIGYIPEPPLQAIYGMLGVVLVALAMTVRKVLP